MSIRIEQEVKLQVPRRFDLRAFEGGVNGYTASPIEAHKISTVYYDTDDLRLTRWGCSLRYRKGQGWTLKLPTIDSEAAPSLRRVEHTFPDVETKPPAKALELVTAFVRGKPLRPVARLRTTRKSLRLHGASGEEIAEVVDDDVRVMHNGRVASRFREVEVELRDGAPQSVLADLTKRLQAAGAGSVDATPKSVRALGPAAHQASEVQCPQPTVESPASEVVRHTLASSVERLMRQDAALRLNMDPEAVHQARVATRRLRSDLRSFLPLLQEDWACTLRDRVKWLADELGAVRDADVLLTRLQRRASQLPEEDVAAAEAVIERFARECSAARRRLLETLRQKRYLDLLKELVAAAAAPKLDPRASEPATAVLPELVEEPWEKLCKAIEAVGDEADDEKLHNARIKAKRCRYAAEAIAPVGGKQALRFARRVQKLQKILGDLHDAVVAQQRLREIAGTRDEVYVAGELAAMEALTARVARAAWLKAWKKASKKSLRSWM